MEEKWGYLEEDESQQKAKQDKKESGGGRPTTKYCKMS